MSGLRTVTGVIDRRLLINYRVEPAVISELLPEPFRPQIVAGQAVAGICLIRLSQIRPVHTPAWIGWRSENAAHRIAVEWDTDEGARHGVFITRRDSASRINVASGGRVFPGWHHHATIKSNENSGRYEVHMQSKDRKTYVEVVAHETDTLPSGSIFRTLAQASTFFERDSIGFSPTRGGEVYEAIELKTASWEVRPLEIERVRSSFFENIEMFPAGSAELDCTLLMKEVQADWHAVPGLATSGLRLAHGPSPSGARS